MIIASSYHQRMRARVYDDDAEGLEDVGTPLRMMIMMMMMIMMIKMMMMMMMITMMAATQFLCTP